MAFYFLRDSTLCWFPALHNLSRYRDKHIDIHVNAPIIEEYPLTLECKVRNWDPQTGYLIGEIVASQADESILTDGKVDLGKLRPIIFDPSFNAYRVVGEIVGKAFSDGLKLK